MNASESLRAFLRFINECRALNEMARKEISKEDKRLQDFLHAIEFESRAKDRNKI